MTLNKTLVQNGINAWDADGGGDFKEANLYALERVANDTPWRNDSTRILVWFGDAPGHVQSGRSTLASATAALVVKKIVVQALDVGDLNDTGQATSITLATGGDLYQGVCPGNVVAKINGSIQDVFQTYKKVELHPPAHLKAVQVKTVPLVYEGVYYRNTSNTFPFNVTFKCLLQGKYDFEINVLVDGGLVATETDSINCITTASGNRLPDCSKAVASPRKIWPPDLNFRSVLVNGVTDPDGDNVTINVTSIFQDEPVNKQSDGTCPDAEISSTGVAQVRAKRRRGGNGRVYHIKFQADDGMGGNCTGKVAVCIPRNNRGWRKRRCVNGGSIYNSTKCR